MDLDALMATAATNAATTAPATAPAAAAAPASGPTQPGAAPAAGVMTLDQLMALPPPGAAVAPPQQPAQPAPTPEAQAAAAAMAQPSDVVAAPPAAVAPLADLGIGRDWTRDGTGDPLIGTLFLNCAPDRGHYVRAQDLIHDAIRELAAGGCADYRLVDFGKGRGMLAAAVAKRLRAADRVVLYTDTDAGQTVAELFCAAASEIIR